MALVINDRVKETSASIRNWCISHFSSAAAQGFIDTLMQLVLELLMTTYYAIYETWN